MPELGPRHEYLAFAVTTEEGLRSVLDALREVGVDTWLADLAMQIDFITHVAGAVRAGDVDVSVTSVDRLRETATFSRGATQFRGRSPARAELMQFAQGLMERVSSTMAGCVYVCEDNQHEWPCGLPGRGKLCPDRLRWIQQTR